MANHPEVPKSFHNDLAYLDLNPENNAEYIEETFGPQDGSPKQINVYNQSRRFLFPYEVIMKKWAEVIPDNDPNITIINNNKGQLESFTLKGNRFDFNDKGQILKITVAHPAETSVEKDLWIELSSPSGMKIVDDATPKVEYPVGIDGSCEYTRDKMFTTALERFLKEALKPLRDPN